jgi:hypothetical protein
MQLPTDYQEIVADGWRTLGVIATRARVHAERTPGAPEFWLSVRDFQGLAGRVAELEAECWEQGYAQVLFGGQDVGVLDELLQGNGSAIATGALDVTPSEASALRRFRTFLSDYMNGVFDRPQSAP